MYSLNMHIAIDASDVHDRLDHLNTAHSPEALALWLLETIGPFLQMRAKRRFRIEGDDASGPWAELSKSTHAFRLSQGYIPDHPINKRTGRLERYITRSAINTWVQGSSAMLVFPSNPPRGATKQKVQTAQYGKMYPRTVPRPVLALGPVDYTFIQKSINIYVKRAVSHRTLKFGGTLK